MRDPIASYIVFEDRDVLVVNKPAGMLTSSGPRDKRPTLWGLVQARAAVLRRQRAPMGLIHRLDRDACGLLVFSKNDDAYQSLKKQFFKHTVDRVYMAIVKGAPKPPIGRVQSQLIEWKDGTVHSTKQRNKGEKAVSHYELCASEQGYSLVRVRLETGRKHQIRVHLSEMGCPIVGDAFYNKDAAKGDWLMLAAMQLSFEHPGTAERMNFEIPLPSHLREFLRALKETGAPPQAPKTPEPPKVYQPRKGPPKRGR